MERDFPASVSLGSCIFDTHTPGNPTCKIYIYIYMGNYMAVCHNLVPLVNIKIAGKWMFIPLKMVLIGMNRY